MVAMRLAVFCVFLIVFVDFDGSDGVPRPCPQFLPVAVKLDSPRITQRDEALVNVKDEKENVISKDSENNPVIYPSDLLLPLNEEKNNADKYQETRTDEKSIAPELETKEVPKNTIRPAVERFKKRRRSRPKEPKRLILSQNSNWSLKTINDKPAMEVLVTDKASVARDLKDVTESAVVSVKKLEDSKK